MILDILSVSLARASVARELVRSVGCSQPSELTRVSSRAAMLRSRALRRGRGAVMVEYVWVLAIASGVLLGLKVAAPAIVESYAQQRAILYSKDP